MKTLKGFNEGEIRRLTALTEEARRKNRKLAEAFTQFAAESGRAKGSVRNFYYDFVRMCSEDSTLSARFFTSPPTVSHAKAFDGDETRWLIRKILLGKQQNKSVRRTIIELSSGDEKLMLRYQNKYRNVLKNSRGLIEEIALELGMEEAEYASVNTTKVPEITLKRLKSSINMLVENIAASLRRENVTLKESNENLTRENRALRALLACREDAPSTAAQE